MIPLVDVHAHLDDHAFSADLAAVLQRAHDAGVHSVLCNGISPATNRAVLALSRAHPHIIQPCLGLYPMEALKLSEKEIDAELAWIRTQHPLAIGEVGLDYKESTLEEEHAVQRDTFKKVMALAIEMKKAIIVHTRKAEQDAIAMVREAGVKKAVFHAFGGKRKLATEIASEHWYLSIPPLVVRDEHFQQIVKDVPLSQLLTETDAPYLGPERDTRNEPAFVKLTVGKIAEIKGLTFEETANLLFANYQRVFL